MDPQVTAALEECRPRIERRPDWGDVLDRARVTRRTASRRRPRPSILAAAAVALLAVLPAVTPAAGLRGKLHSFFELSRSAEPAACSGTSASRCSP